MALTFDHKSSTPRIFFARITPEEALFILDNFMPTNRPVRQDAVAAYARDMQAGRWYQSTSSIGFDRDGMLFDGQHRLWACVEAQQPFETSIKTGLDPRARDVTDVGLKRNISDILMIKNGTRTPKTAIAVARMLFGLKSATTHEVLESLHVHHEAIAWAMEEPYTRVRAVTHSGLFTVLARAYYTQDREKCRMFRDQLISGINANVTVAALRAVMQRDGWVTGGVNMSKTMYYKIERGLRAFLDDETLTKVFPASVELFKLPHEK